MSGIQLGLAGNVSLCCDMGLVGKYPKYVPKYSEYVTLLSLHCPHRALLACFYDSDRIDCRCLVRHASGATRTQAPGAQKQQGGGGHRFHHLP
jgi:hypothetical protein